MSTPSIRWVSEPDRGQSHALNKGFALASGDVLGWLNADDAYKPTAVAEAVAAIESTGAALVYADVTRVDDDGDNPRRIRSRPSFELWTELNLGCGIYSPAVFFSRAALDAAGPLDESLHLTMDYDLWLRIGERFPGPTCRLDLGDPTSARRREDDASLRRLLAGATVSKSASRRKARITFAHLAIRPRPARAAHRHACRCGGVCARGEAAALMCGLCGIVELDRSPDRATVERWLDELAHRGPDGRGVFAADGVCLGHVRLAILDLSDAGLQPMQDGELQLLHNGEIYNYLELREELRATGHAFSTGTDSEVILAAYRQWGERCVERFNGMWAFVIWDASRRTLFCSRDRFGVKPFYYRVAGDRFSFASEPWLLSGGEANLRAVRDYLAQGYLDEGNETFFADVVRLPPAHSLTFGPDGLTIRRYWSLESKHAPSDPVAAVRETFLDAVRLQLRSDVPVGTCLSGGIDSSSIAVAVAEHGHDHQKTVTAYFSDRGFDERPFAQAVVDRTGRRASLGDVRRAAARG